MRQLRPVLIGLWLHIMLSAAESFAQPDTARPKHGGFTGLPYINYTPETNLAIGAAGIYAFHSGADVQPNDRPSVISGGIGGTTRRQFVGVTNFDLYFKNMAYRLYGRGSAEQYPFEFYGVGNNTATENQEIYTPVLYRFDITAIKNFHRTEQGQGFNAGLRYEFRSERMVEQVRGGLLYQGIYEGSDGGRVCGSGFDANWDTRDNIFSTTSGTYIESQLMFYRGLFGSEFKYTRYFYDIRKFFPLDLFGLTSVLALQTGGNFINGAPPFSLLASFGGDRIMRGYFFGRFRDNLSVFGQAEFRLQVLARFGIAFFTGIGQVAPNFAQLGWDEMKYSGGIGVRYFVRPGERMSLRVDYGIGENSSQFYLTFLEAF
jgi:outer membrane protein assembly factor BamA